VAAWERDTLKDEREECRKKEERERGEGEKQGEIESILINISPCSVQRPISHGLHPKPFKAGISKPRKRSAHMICGCPVYPCIAIVYCYL
jgi:hypothetical protein